MNYNFLYKKIATLPEILLQKIEVELNDYDYNYDNYFCCPNHMLVYDYPNNPLNINISIIINLLSKVLNPKDFQSASIDYMLPNSFLKPHVDQAIPGPNKLLQNNLHKIHIPIITNDNAKQIWITYKKNYLDPQIVQFERASVYAHNNMVSHCAINLSSKPRYHLIMRYYHTVDYDWMQDG